MARRSGTNSQYSFANIPAPKISRSVFNRSHGHKTTVTAGELIPIYVDEALPGDTFNCKLSLFARAVTLLYPIMDNIWCDVHFYSVPYRLVWKDFQYFMGERDPGEEDVQYSLPRTSFPSPGVSSFERLADYFGIPMQNMFAEPVNVLPFRAYNLIYNEWYRDQDLTAARNVNRDLIGNDPVDDYAIMRRNKRHDYFTSARPWPQKGAPVTISIGESAPVVISSSGDGRPLFDGATGGTAANVFGTGAAPSQIVGPNDQALTGELTWNDPKLEGVADLSQAESVTVNDLRTAFQLQRMLEKDSRGGTRYTETLRNHFGVTSPDARLQRPEYLGGGTLPVMVRAVPSTGGIIGETGRPVGDLAATGTVSGSSARFTHSFTEHCVVMGILSFRADLSYQQGLHKMWSRSSKYDLFWPSLQHLGEQAILNKEIYKSPAGVEDDQVFGYQERYAEYKYKPSLITGELRSTSPLSLDAWHLAQEFTSLPQLDANFIREAPPMTRVKAITTTTYDFIVDSFIDLKCVRPMPVYAVPGMIDHL